jgi:Zn-dependent protease with chaperone function
MVLEPRLRSPKEQPLFALGVVVSSLTWLVLTCTLVGLVYGAFIAAFVLIAHALFLAHVRGNGLRLSERQLPELYARCVAASKKLGMDEVPEFYVLQYGGLLNAFATKLLSRKFVIILSDLVDGCEDPRQLDFVIGHELGHLAAGHLKWQAFLAPINLVPLLGAAYSRACEYTCDRCGLEVAGELEAAQRGLAVLAAGGRQASRVNLAAFMDQRQETGGFWMSVGELASSHPYLCKRVAELKEYVQPGTVAPVGRSPLAYPLAPLFGGGAGGMGVALMVVWMMGLMAAIAIPNFLKFQERARAQAEAQQAGDAQEPEWAEDPDAEEALADEEALDAEGAPADAEPQQASDSAP